MRRSKFRRPARFLYSMEQGCWWHTPRSAGSYAKGIGSLLSVKSNLWPHFVQLWSLHCKYREPLSGKVEQRHKKAEGCLCSEWVWWYYRCCLVILVLFPNLCSEKRRNGFARKTVSLLFMYRFDISSVRRVFAAQLPKRADPQRATIFR